MGVFDFLRTSAPEPASAVRSSPPVRAAVIESSADLDGYLRGGSDTASGESIGPRESLRTAAVYRCVNILCGVIGSLPVDIKDEETLVTDRDHQLRRLLNRKPNGWQTAHEFKKQIQNAVLLQGNGYARKVRQGNRIIALIPMASHATAVEQKRDGTLSYEYTDKFGRTMTLGQQDVFHVRGMSLDGVTGLSVIGYAREAIGLSRAAEKHGAALFRNGTRVGGAYSHPNTLSDGAYERLKGDLEQFRSGGEREMKDMILEEGMKYEPFGMTSQDAEFIENRKFSVQEIAMFFGVPPHMIGFTEKATSWGSGIEQQSIGFVNYTLNDWFEAWEGAIERDLLGSEMNNIAEFDTTKLLRGDEKGRWDSNRIKLEMGALNADEVRRSEGLPAKPNGEGQKYYDPPNVPQTGGDNEPQEPTED